MVSVLPADLQFTLGTRNLIRLVVLLTMIHPQDAHMYIMFLRNNWGRTLSDFFLMEFHSRSSVCSSLTCHSHWAQNSNHYHNYRKDARHAALSLESTWLHIGCLPYHQWHSHQTKITNLNVMCLVTNWHFIQLQKSSVYSFVHFQGSKVFFWDHYCVAYTIHLSIH